MRQYLTDPELDRSMGAQRQTRTGKAQVGVTHPGVTQEAHPEIFSAALVIRAENQKQPSVHGQEK